MAMCDYYLCDVCGQKCFYDAGIAEYDDDNNYLLSGAKVDIAAICESCAKTHECIVVRKETDGNQASTEVSVTAVGAQREDHPGSGNHDTNTERAQTTPQERSAMTNPHSDKDLLSVSAVPQTVEKVRQRFIQEWASWEPETGAEFERDVDALIEAVRLSTLSQQTGTGLNTDHAGDA